MLTKHVFLLPQFCSTTELRERMGPRLHELAPAARGGQDAESRNLGPLFRGTLYNTLLQSCSYTLKNFSGVRFMVPFALAFLHAALTGLPPPSARPPADGFAINDDNSSRVDEGRK